MWIVPEEEYDINEVVRKVKEGYESGAKTHHVIVLAEGVMGAEEFAAKMKEAGDTSDLRATNIGHVVRGGSPTARDRVLASWMGAHAVDLLKQGIGGVAVGIHNEELVESPILGTAEEGALFSLTEDGKIIVNNLVKHDRWGYSLNWGWRRDQLADLERMFYLLDGKAIPDNRHDVAIRFMDFVSAHPHEQVFDDDLFVIRYYQKGSGHITFKRLDLVDKMNDIVAKHYPGMLAAR